MSHEAILFILYVAWLERHQVHLDVSLRQTAIYSSDTKRYARY